DSLVSSISIAEREVEPGAMVGSTACEGNSDAQYGTAGRQKKIGVHPIPHGTGNFALKPGLNCSVFVNTRGS
ncbi:MAG: hypothetical protein ABWY82_28015, partial [Tardiphaga sp.]